MAEKHGTLPILVDACYSKEMIFMQKLKLFCKDFCEWPANRFLVMEYFYQFSEVFGKLSGTVTCQGQVVPSLLFLLDLEIHKFPGFQSRSVHLTCPRRWKWHQ